MPDFTAKDVQRLRQATGAGMMDAKRALNETSGDFDAAAAGFVPSLGVPPPHDHTIRDDNAIQTKGATLVIVISHHLGGAG